LITVITLLFELCLQFGEITIENEENNKSLTLEIFWPGKQVSDWRDARLNVASVSP